MVRMDDQRGIAPVTRHVEDWIARNYPQVNASTKRIMFGPSGDSAIEVRIKGPDPDTCLLYTSDAADEGLGVDLGGRRIIKKKKRGEGWREGVGGGARRQSGSERLFCFFFQAEDGIRDLVRSRGLGDVYKRQLRADYGADG